MSSFLIVYKHNASISEYKNMRLTSDGALSLSEVQLKIMEIHKWKLTDFAIINIIPIKTELYEDGGKKLI